MSPIVGWGIAVFLLTVAVFAVSLGGGFSNWDDETNVLANPMLHPPSWRNFGYAWGASYEALYIPVLYSAYMVEMLAGGGSAIAFHAVNMVLHAASAVMVFFLIRAILPSSSDVGRWRDPAAAVGALIFGLHPLQVEPVAWVTGQKDVLSGFLALAAVCLYLLWRQRGGRIHYVAALVLFVLSTLTKPAAVAVPLALLLLDVVWLSNPWRRVLVALIPWFVVASAVVVVTALVQTPSPTLKPALGPVWSRPFVAADALVFYIRRILLPIDLAPVYGRTPVVVLAGWWNYLALPAVLVAAILLLRRGGTALIASGWFVVFFLPVLGLVPFGFQKYSTVADRYAYLSMAGIGLAVAWGLTVRPSRPVIWGIMIAILMVFAGLSVRQQLLWRDSAALWSHNLAIAPESAVVHAQYGNACTSAGQAAQAEQHLREALRLAPDEPYFHNNLASLLVADGRVDEAVEHFLRAAECDPRYASPHYNLGQIYKRKGLAAEAEREYRAAIAAKPYYYEARLNLGALLLEKGDLPGAEAETREALRLNPSAMAARRNLAGILAKQGRLNEAAEELHTMLARNPGDAESAAMLRQIEGALRP
ncbi:MAG: tetratricopeptide repeat protein [Candidatus Sumerlaeaceae bacterium]|nr:tetratricopeptide repeat protein [Candidatus Sumerlaeaceae bacterium]